MTATSPPGVLKRRGLLTGLAALAGGGLARAGTATPAEAGHNTNIAYDSQTVMHLDVTNTTAGSSRISSNISGTAAFVALNNYPVGISRPDGMLGRTMYTTSNCAGVAGTCEAASGGLGVMGAAKAANGTGVYGFSGSVVPSTVAPGGTGVYGSGPSYGVYATTANGIGVFGATSTVAQPGIRGDGPGVGVVGNGTGSGIGVFGTAQNGAALLGVSQNGTGLSASTNSTAGAGVFASADAPGGVGAIGVVGHSTAGTGIVGQGAIAGRFDGPVIVNGSFSVVGGAKSAAVVHPDGSHRRMYCQESPEPWFEDFGEAKLVGGTATVKLDPDFAALVQTDRYQVFLAEYEEDRGLFVTARKPDSFEVRAKGGDGAFGYRIVAPRKDKVGSRLEKITLPSGDLKGPLKLPGLPAPIKLAELPALPTTTKPAEDEALPGR
jgi:hypothetical protein